jgi:hypothetical protein
MAVAKRQKKQRRWKGTLARKIRPQIIRPQGLADTDSETVAQANEQMVDLYQQAVEKAVAENLDLLAKHYGIAADDYRNLAIRLTIELGIPGFQVEPTVFEIEDGYGLVQPANKAGRPSKWPLERLDELVIAVEKARKEPDFTEDRKALEHLARREKWTAPRNHRGNWIKTLQNRLGEAKKNKRFIDRQADKWRKVIEELKRGNPGN